MRPGFGFLALFLCLTACATTDVDDRLSKLVGQDVQQAISRLGAPDGPPRMTDGDKDYVWTTNQNIASSEWSTGPGMINLKHSRSVHLVHLDCTFHLATDQNDRVKSYRWSGTDFCLRYYADLLSRNRGLASVSTPLDVTGVWQFMICEFVQRPPPEKIEDCGRWNGFTATPLCTFQQTGEQISGTCEDAGGTGSAEGFVSGNQLSFVWHTAGYGGRGFNPGDLRFNGTLERDGTISGAAANGDLFAANRSRDYLEFHSAWRGHWAH